MRLWSRDWVARESGGRFDRGFLFWHRRSLLYPRMNGVCVPLYSCSSMYVVIASVPVLAFDISIAHASSGIYAPYRVYECPIVRAVLPHFYSNVRAQGSTGAVTAGKPDSMILGSLVKPCWHEVLTPGEAWHYARTTPPDIKTAGPDPSFLHLSHYYYRIQLLHDMIYSPIA